MLPFCCRLQKVSKPDPFSRLRPPRRMSRAHEPENHTKPCKERPRPAERPWASAHVGNLRIMLQSSIAASLVTRLWPARAPLRPLKRMAARLLKP